MPGKTANTPIPSKIPHNWQGKTATPNSIMYHCGRKTAIPIKIISISIQASISKSKARQQLREGKNPTNKSMLVKSSTKLTRSSQKCSIARYHRPPCGTKHHTAR